jgi:hypothetical protein
MSIKIENQMTRMLHSSKNNQQESTELLKILAKASKCTTKGHKEVEHQTCELLNKVRSDMDTLLNEVKRDINQNAPKQCLR